MSDALGILSQFLNMVPAHHREVDRVNAWRENGGATSLRLYFKDGRYVTMSTDKDVIDDVIMEAVDWVEREVEAHGAKP